MAPHSHSDDCNHGHSHGPHDGPPIVEAIRTGLCAILGLIGAGFHYSPAIPFAEYWAMGFCATAYATGGWGPFLESVQAARKGRLGVDLLMVLAALGAAAIGDWLEGTVLLFLFALSHTLEEFATYRTNRSIESLIQLRPHEATRYLPTEQKEERVPTASLAVGNLIRIRPGERFPIDGVVVEGETWADEATLTGESEPIHKPEGSNVFSGTINTKGSVLVRMTKLAEDTTLQRIVHMVQEAQAQKTPTQRFVESWQQPYVIGVLIASSLVFVGARYVHSQDWYDAFYHAMVILVAASPCAVVVSTPAVMLSAIARAGRHGILFKGAVHVESLGQIETLALDKTGTLTLGRPGVSEVWATDEAYLPRMLALAAAVERRSEHPLAAPVLAETEARQLTLPEKPLQDFHSHTGLGVHARIEGAWVGVGREGLFKEHGVDLPESLVEKAQSVRILGQTALIVVVVEERLYGIIALADQVRPEAADVLKAIHKLGIHKTIMLTGDHERVAVAVAKRLNVDEVRAGLMPDQKVQELRRLDATGNGVAMIGDGVNDAPALATARVGIAMGGAGTDVALEVADVVFMRDDLQGLPFAIWLSRLARRKVRQNMIFSFGMIGLLVLSTFANLPLWLGVLGHEGSTVIVVFNGLSLLWLTPPTFTPKKAA